jgi:hypothetical protein
MRSSATAFASVPAPEGRTDELFGILQREITASFPARHIAMLVDRGGRLVLFGEPTGPEIASAAMLLASVHVRLSSDHTYVSPAIPGAVLLRLLLPTDRGSILLAPVCDQGNPIGAIVIEGPSGHAFSAHDLTRLRAVIRTSETQVMQA